MQFAISERPLTQFERANFTNNAASMGSPVHFPLFVNVYGLFYNIPGENTLTREDKRAGVILAGNQICNYTASERLVLIRA
jgi:hypothetical protein